MMGMGPGFGALGALFMFLFWAGLIALAIWLISALFPRDGRQDMSITSPDLSPQEILDRRYARGEISREQYELMKQDLR